MSMEVIWCIALSDQSQGEWCGSCGSCLDQESLPCGLECGVRYCSAVCRKRDFEVAGHKYICVGQCQDESHPLYQFKILAFGSGYFDEMNLALKVLATALQEKLDGSKACCMELLQDTPRWDSFSSEPHAVAELVQDSFLLLQQGIPALEQFDRDDWNKILSFVVQNNICWQGALEPSLLKLTRSLNGAPPEQIEAHKEHLLASVAALNDCEQDDDESGDDESGDGSSSESHCRNHNETLTIGRLLSEPERYIPSPTVVGVVLQVYQHSCVPSVDMSLEKQQAHLAAKAVETKWNKAEQKECETVCVVDRKADLEDRQAELMERGLAPCSCPRCLFETGQRDGITIPQMEALLELAQTDMRLDDALVIAEEILGRNPASSFAMYTKARVLAWSDRWTEAHACRVEATKVCEEMNTNDTYLQLMQKQIEDELLFSYENIHACSLEELEASFETVPSTHSNIYVSKPGCPIISPEQAKQVVVDAEAFAAENGGWSSTRHYSVPTTDIPVYSIPVLRERLRPVFEKLFPFLAAMYGVQASDIRFIDAFVVKYSAQKQHFLPVHCDQSQFSVTIALNDRSEYEGGGTWFPELDQALNCDAGGIVSFPGDTVHGGNAISSGTRYIIAGFLYAQVG